MSLEEAKKYHNFKDSDELISLKLESLETLIRKYTNNNFQYRNIRFLTKIESDKITNAYTHFFKVGDTLEVSQSIYNDGLYVVKSVSGDTLTLDKPLYKDDEVLVTKVVYPQDIKMGVINLLKWDEENREKIGVQSETISRHSVTYFSFDKDNSLLGYPSSLLGFLKPYMKARF